MFEDRRRQLVAYLESQGVVRSPRVRRALLAVPRELFMPEAPDEAYEDEAFVFKREGDTVLSSISQPSIVAVMLEQLDVGEGMRVLEIGAGSGYNAALLAELAGPDGAVVTIDLDPGIVARARRGLVASGHGNVVVVEDDGARGYEAGAPFDRIIVTAAVPDLSRPWVEQLRHGGILVAPLTLLRQAQVSAAFRKLMDDRLVSESLYGCGFMPIRGDLQRTEAGDPGSGPLWERLERLSAGGDLGQFRIEAMPSVSGVQAENCLERPIFRYCLHAH